MNTFDNEFITFDNVRSSSTKRQDMFPVILALCFVLKIFRCSEHYAPKLETCISFLIDVTSLFR